MKPIAAFASLIAAFAVLLAPLAASAYTVTKTATFTGITSTPTFGYTLYSPALAVIAARTTSGISSAQLATGTYAVSAAVTPPDSSQDIIVWDDGSGHYTSADRVTPIDAQVTDADAQATASAAQTTAALQQANAATGVWSAATRTLTGIAAANVAQIGGYSVTAPSGGVTFPASVGTSTYAGGAVASVAAPVTVGGYASGQDPASLVWGATTRTVTGGTVALSSNDEARLGNLDAAVSTRLAASAYTAPPTDYQQRGVAVTLPASAPTGYGGGATLAQITALLPPNFALCYIDPMTGGVKVYSLPSVPPAGYGPAGLIH